MDVGVEIQRVAQRTENVEDVVEAELGEIRHLRRALKRELRDILAHVGRLELRTPVARLKCDEVVGDGLTAQEQRDDVRATHTVTLFMKSTASFCTTCVAAQVMRSTPPPFFSL